MKKHILLFILIYLTAISITVAQTWPADTIQTFINSGNPKFPFPQFNEYSFGKSLAKFNAEGVTHADMEKSMKEAYKMMMHRSLYSGQVYGGVKYIKYNTDAVPANFGTFVSEGDGYALLAAAYFADKKTFDGLWMWIHDNRLSNITQYYQCKTLRGAYPYGNLIGWKTDESVPVANESANSSSTDGDQDIAMALLIAYKQWGENMGVNDACGKPISYKMEALNLIKAMVDTVYYNKSISGSLPGTLGYLSGDIGIDGYIKSGNTWGEMTTWRSSAANNVYPWAKPIPDPITSSSKYLDYLAPAYYHEFAQFLSENGGTSWQINQFKRAETSSDWLIGEMYKKGYIASAGTYTVNNDGSAVTFGSFSTGEDFRTSWRTILNYVWHGNSDSSWNPVTHQKIAGANTFEYDMGVRHASFLKFPRTMPSDESMANCGILGASPDISCPKWKGVSQLKQGYLPTGALNGNYTTNFMAGTGAPASVASGDIDLTAELYRQCEINWEDALSKSTGMTDDERYIKSTPKYFHDWFRLLGMLTTTGNLQSPASITPAANLKVYMSVDKTFAYSEDLVTYTVSYRNYGSVAASGVSITTSLDNNYQFVSATNGGVLSGNKIVWNIGSVPGYVTSGIAATQGTVKFTVKVKSVSSAANTCLSSVISASNASSWTSNQYPNNASYTMERNCVDLLPSKTLVLTKSVDRSEMNAGDVINVKLVFANQSMENGLKGGRDRVVVSYANFAPTPAYNMYQFYRIWHSAPEAYINLGNYRVSYFLNDPAIGAYNATSNPNGWSTFIDNQSDLDKYGYNPLTKPINQQLNFTYQKMQWGSDANGSWNQRFVTQFANVLSAPSSHVYDKMDSDYLIHKGVKGPGFARTRFLANPPVDLKSKIADDWSYSLSVANSGLDGQANRFFPISPSYTNALTTVVNNFSKDVCDASVANFSKILVEEFDGYIWRKIAGNAPIYGIEANNVLITDTIPKNFIWKGFKDSTALGIKASYTPAVANANYSGIVSWTIPAMFIGSLDTLSYQIVPKSITCPIANITVSSSAWISSQTNSQTPSTVGLTITCNALPPTAPTESSLVKLANKTDVKVSETITYTLTFTNKDGSTGEWKGTNTLATEWQAAGSGVLPKINSSTLSLDQNSPGNPSQTAFGYGFEHTKVHGVNGWIESTLDVTNASKMSFFFRHSAGTPGQSDFRGVRLEISPNSTGPNTMDLTLFNNEISIFSQTNVSFAGSFDPIKFRVELIDDKMYIWANDFNTAPLKTVSGITALNVGYSGIFANTSQQIITAWKGHFDSAFDVIISDPLPSTLSNASNISNAGTINSGTITWPSVAGPVLAGSILKRTFDAVVTTCKDYVVNIAKASTFGVSDIKSQSAVKCSFVTGAESEQEGQSFSVYPNPFKNLLYLESSKGLESATIKSATGIVVLQKTNMDATKFTISEGIENLPIGMYFVELHLTNGSKHLQKIMKVE